MVFPTRTRGLPWKGAFLAAMAALAVCGRASAGDVPGKPATARLDAAALTRLIDQAVQQRLAEEKVTPASRADDAEFLRRVYLDITGVIPPADKVAVFLDSKQPDKRARLIDDLLASPNYGRRLADIWQEQLMAEQDLLTKGMSLEPLASWLAKGFNANKPWDQVVTELLTSTGTQAENGATTLFLAHRSPDRLTDTVCRTLL